MDVINKLLAFSARHLVIHWFFLSTIIIDILNVRRNPQKIIIRANETSFAAISNWSETEIEELRLRCMYLALTYSRREMKTI